MATQHGQHVMPYLLFRCGGRLCALPLSGVRETMRPQPVDAIAGAPPFVLGLSIVRGQPVPIVHLARLLDAAPRAAPRRLILVELGGNGRARQVGIAVDDVLGVRRLDLGASPAPDSELPALLRDADVAGVASLKRLDGELLWLLLAARVLPTSLLDDVEAASEASA